jgi:hypothetical protein
METLTVSAALLPRLLEKQHLLLQQAHPLLIESLMLKLK